MATAERRWQERDKPYAALGAAIKAARQRMNGGRGVTQVELSLRIGANESYIGVMEGGTRRPRPRWLEAIAAVAGCDKTALMELAGYRTSMPGDLRIDGDGTEAGLLRQYAEYPPHLLRLGLDLLRRIEQEMPHPDEEDHTPHQNGESAA